MDMGFQSSPNGASGQWPVSTCHMDEAGASPMLSHVVMTREVFEVCATHALSTEKEENMGLLLGDVKPVDEFEHLATVQGSTTGSRGANSANRACLIWGLSIQVRSDRRKDRVEIAPEGLIASSQEAERLEQKIGQPTRVVGWYHSHPHITVLPSHVDVKTQHSYQHMDKDFIGLIFACFLKAKSDNEQSQSSTRMQLIAFQSIDCETSPNLATRAMKANFKATGQRYQRREIPISVVPLEKLVQSPAAYEDLLLASLRNLYDLQNTFYQEEKHSYQHFTFGDSTDGHSKSKKSSAQQKSPHPLTFRHNSGVYCKTLCKKLEYDIFPVLQVLHQKQQELAEKLSRGESIIEHQRKRAPDSQKGESDPQNKSLFEKEYGMPHQAAHSGQNISTEPQSTNVEHNHSLPKKRARTKSTSPSSAQPPQQLKEARKDIISKSTGRTHCSDQQSSIQSETRITKEVNRVKNFFDLPADEKQMGSRQGGHIGGPIAVNTSGSGDEEWNNTILLPSSLSSRDLGLELEDDDEGDNSPTY